MKYKFVKKGKNLTPADIKAQMNFDNVVKGASIWAGFKLGATLLKLGSKMTATVVAGTSTVVVTAAVVVATNTDLLKRGDNASTAEQIEIQAPLEEPTEDEIIPVQVDSTQVEEEEKEEDNKANATPSNPPNKAKTKRNTTVPKPLPQRNIAMDSIDNEDVIIRARPVPDLKAFLDFIDRELKYPIDPIEVVDNDDEEPIEGYVEVFFTVNKEGKAENFKIKKSLGTLFDNEAIRVLKMYQKWQPASYNGDAVDSNLKFKINFQVK